MAMDGSFSLELSLQWFFARCPKVGRGPRFELLAKKGHLLTEEEVVSSVAELLLHPKYTIPLIGCFRPIAQKIVDKAVTLLRLVPNLRSNSDNNIAESGYFDDDEVINLIEFHIQHGRGLDLHELACLAFCRALDLAPFLLGSVLNYFKFAPPPFERIFERISMKGSGFELSGKVITYYLHVVRTSYRLLVMETEFFSKYWDWSCFLDLVKKVVILDQGSDVKFEDITDIRWCAIQILSVILKMNDRATAKFGVGAEEAHSCLLRWEEFCQDIAVEKAGAYIRTFEHINSDSENGELCFSQDNCLQLFGLCSFTSSQFHETEPPLRSRKLVEWDDKSVGNPFVMTSSLKRSYERVLLAVSQKWPVLLYGPAGAGKSALISKMARDCGNQVLTIHMDDQIDGKTLIGSYVCTEQPGEFRWQPGSLTQAVVNGFWVVFEDIDKAPSDVLSMILPLLEGSSLLVTGFGEEIRVAESFRLFSTISTFKSDISHGIGGNLNGVLWRKVMIEPPSNQDLQKIVRAWYPSLEPLVEKLLETFEGVNSIAVHQVVGFQPGNSASLSSPSKFSSRDLLKWCKRIAGLHFISTLDVLTSFECFCIYQEAVDVFAAFSTSVGNRLTIMKDIAKKWTVPISQAETLYPHDEPIIQDLLSELRIGRVTLQRTEATLYDEKRPFVKIHSSLHVLERIACSVKYNEPVLLVGETGTGKTTLVQNLAMRLGQKLTVLNLSQQSDVADLLGGFKPMDAQSICIPLYNEFKFLFSKAFSMKDNHGLFARLQDLLCSKNWEKLLRKLKNGVNLFRKLVEEERSGSARKRKKPLDVEKKVKAWDEFSARLETARRQIASSGMVFSFVEGVFVTALKNGQWILLDEINLAPPEILQRVIGVLEGENGSLCLAERGDVSNINRHPNFRVFACMNPATDAGKRDLPYALRSRFTEYFVDDILDDHDLDVFIQKFLGDGRSNSELVEKIRRFYKIAKKDSEERLQDGANQKPQYSLRSLYRALEFTRKAERKFAFQNAIYDGFCMFFVSLLDRPSAKKMKQRILQNLIEKKPLHVPFHQYLMVKENSSSDEFLKNYVLTKSVKKHLRNLSRAVFIKRYPVLLQGPTSSGKTSLVQYLATITGHEFVRINNHEHTDLQEYLGSYIVNAHGKLVFQEGVLVNAVRNGYWIVLDELNLAPTDVLEALNRLLDDNRELFVPELRETIRAHPDFMLFATQNPPTFYGGRKMLSRAFRNRFVEIHVDEIPEDELSTILKQRCQIPESYAKKMVEVMKELQLHRQSSKVFAGKHGFITPRDLFRWADRFRISGISYEDLARDGYHLLAERLRVEDEKLVVQEVLERHLRVKLVKDDLYKPELLGEDPIPESLGNVILTKSMRRLYFLVRRCYKFREPVLLVGETGGGKTTVCQLLSIALGLNLHILNCHQYTETSDFLGGFYPIRDRSRLSSEYKCVIEQLKLLKAHIDFPQDLDIFSDICHASSTLDQLNVVINKYRQGLLSTPDFTLQDIDTIEKVKQELVLLHNEWQKIFAWQDGPLVQSMKAGDLFLVDEISLADDSVLERLNSVLEPERKLSLAEKGGDVLEKVTAHENFLVLATMNPGGDYGKKELSPALRNRFTEIWVPSVGDLNELRNIALYRLSRLELSYIVNPMVNFYEWFNQLQIGRFLTVRDLLSWIAFVNVSKLDPEHLFLHGAFLVLLDGLSLGTGLSKKDCGELRERCLSFLLELLQVDSTNLLYSKLSKMENYGWGDLETPVEINTDSTLCDNVFSIDPFYIEKGSEKSEVGGFEFLAPTTRKNALRVLRAMQLSKPVLLEGSPGVGKTSLIVALGKFSGHRVVRINLSEQTDMMDLLGSDLPVESDEGMKFAWSDGILLQALKEGCWVLLDELNLAPQSVLEGLNAILDHRAEVFIPELGYTFRCPSSFRVFACQNPSCQGGGRKGLPKSFLNRFTKVYIDELVEEDYLFICSSLYPSIPHPVLSNLISFNRRLHEDTMLYHKFAQNGSPWEFNLRDVLRSCQILQGTPGKVASFLNLIYVQRMRTAADRRQVMQLYEQIFGVKPSINPYPRVQLNSDYLIVGSVAIKRNFKQPSRISSQLKVLPSVRCNLEAAAHCVQQGWLCILIGPPSSGKTSLIRLLAQLTGNVLHELNLSSATDISELLGCFEQYNAFRNFRSVVAQVGRFVNEYSSLLFEISMETFLSDRKDLIARWLAFLSDVDSDIMPSFSFMNSETWNSIYRSLPSLIEIIKQLKSDLEKNVLPISWTSEDLDSAMKTILKLQHHQRMPYFAKFEWVMGLLINAIENGEWIILENANLCNPTVLDRINSLVEPDGTITVNECGIVDGKPVVLHPHSNFRMFLTVNPSFGEVSRAMRNRGVEIFMMNPYWIFDEGSGYNSEELEMKDVKRFLVLAGIPGSKFVDSMAKAHAYAMAEGVRLNVRITYLELARWVQLFQHLLMNGNQPLWSLQISWDHTYLSSFGEAEGVNIVNYAKNAYFSVTELYRSDLSLGHALCLPGGWPIPLTLRDLAWYSKEVYVRQNCSYLEFLGAQYASHELAISCGICPVEDVLRRRGCKGTYLLDWKMLYGTIYPQVSRGMTSDSDGKTEFNSNIVNKMMLFAANWAIEQATENDFQLYLQWFTWFSFQLEPYCHFFRYFLTSLEQEWRHPIWTCIIKCRQELISLNQIDIDLHPFPMLSLELVDLTSSNHLSNASSKPLHDAISCVGLLRCSYQQWNVESRHKYTDESRCFKPFVEALRILEEEILNMLVGSPSYDLLYQLYTNLLEDHILFWEGLISWQFERLLISWRSLLKVAGKLKEFCPKAVKNMLETKNLAEVSSLCFHPERSLLWVHGGHPFLPPSSKLYHQQHQLLWFCELVWSTKRKLFNQVNELPIETMVSFDPELRFLALEGICMSSFIMGICDEDEIHASHQMEEVYQMLLKRFDYEKCKLLIKYGPDDGIFEEISATCCVLSSEMLHMRSGFDSWLDILPIIDCASCFLDMELLQELSLLSLVGSGELQLGLGCLSSRLESDLKYSLTYSTRPPQSFVPHQKLLWLHDAWTSVDAVHAKVSGFVLEMWFWWHSLLWSQCPAFVKNFSIIDGYSVPLPNVLIQPVRTASVAKILQSTHDIKDFSMRCLKLKAASCVLWQISSPRINSHSFLLSAARSLFQQIIYSHKKSFDAEKFAAIKSILCSCPSGVTEESLGLVSLLIASSSHRSLKSLIQLFIEPLLRRLYLNCSSTESYLNLGFAWLHIGGLRFNLLLSCDSLDPASKYSCKLSCLEEKIISHKLEMKVRQECNYLAGWSSSKETDKRISQALEKLEIKCRKLRRKIVFRPDPPKFKALRKECDEFCVLVNSLMSLVNNIEVMELQQIVDKVCNWQETASCFIDRLLNEYSEYIDVAQPIQVAVYEMKLGLALALLSALQKKFLDRIQEDNMDRVMELIYSFMRFPRGCTSELASISDRRRLLIFSSLDIPCIANFSEMELSLLENMVTISSDVIAEKVSMLQLKASLYNNCLVRVAHSVATAKLMDSASFKLLDKIFSGFASIWMHMKIQGKNQEDRDRQPYKFRPRAFRIENVMEVDISALGKLLANDNFIDWQELISEEESTKMMEDGEKHENFEDEWNLMEESILIFMINMHGQLFGSADLILSPGSFQITDVDRLQSFIGSYTLGVGMMKGFGGVFSSMLDAKLVQEHLLRLCCEYEQKFPSPHKAACKYNFYKDSNNHIMAKMVELLSTLKHRVHTLLSEWEDHPGLQKVLDVIEMLLAIPLSTPLAKALSGLQFLLNRTWILEENGSKFSLSDQLKPLISLVCSWQKMEFCSWPVLLDEVQDQYDINAAKLWFPLFSVLHPRHSSDIAGHDQSTIQSLEEFIQTSSIGEFRKRLQLLFAFLGQIITGRSLEIYSSPWQEENIKILYNIFGFYMQFLPIVMELIEANRKKIETELKELLKLCCWDRFDSQLSIDNLRKPRQKIQKLIQKYSDMLQQPFMLILNEEVRQKGFKIVSPESPKPLIDISESCRMLNVFLNLTQSNDEYRSAWYTEWGQKVNDTLNLHLQRISELHFVKSEEISGVIRQCPISQFACLSYPNEWKRVWHTLKRIGTMTKNYGDLWMDVNRSLGKKRALSDLLQLLESSGLHRHKFEILEISNPSSWLFLQPSYDAQHLLMKQTRLPNGVADVASAVEKCLPKETLDSEWKTANEYYFKSLAAVQLLQQIRLKHHPDFTSEQVTRSVSYLSHLIIIQQMQRAAVYDFARQLKTLREYATALDSSYSGCTNFENTNGGCVFAKSQHAIFNCMWQQKLLFDDLDAMLVEESLLLKTVEGTHSNSCRKVKAAANRILGFIERFIPVIKKSKELLDGYFIGCDGSIITLAGTIRLYVISKQMEKVVLQNFKVLQEFEDQLIKQGFEKSSVVESVLSHFDERFSKGKLIAEQLRLALEMGNESKYLHELADSCCEKCPELEAQFGDAFKRTIRQVIDVLQKLSSLDNHGSQPEAPSESITAWESLFKSTIANLGVDTLCEKLLETIHFAENLFNHSSMKVSGQSFHIGALLKHIHDSVDLILSFSDSFLEDFLVMHKTVSIVTHGLANILAALFAKGFGDSPKDQEDDTSHDMTQDASGTGMGEGAGVNDVSDQINDEDQLLGASEKPSEEQAASNDVPSKNEKGIEMEQDFAADTFSVSEDSGEDNNEDTEDQQLESAMGETGGNSEVIDEKLWDKDDDDDPNNNEKYESGPSVRDSDKNSREFRAKEDSAGTAEEPEENKMDELDKETDEIENQADLDEHENIEDLNFNKEEEFADPTGLKLDELNERYSEDINMDEKEEVDIKEEDGEDEEEESAKDGNTEGNLNPADETMEEMESERIDGTSERDERVDATFEKDDLGRDKEDPKINQMAGRKNVSESEISNISGDHVPNEGAATQPNSEALELRSVAPEANWANSSDNYNDLALRNFPSSNNSDLNIMVADSSNSGKFTDDHPKTEFPRQDADPFQKKQSNPYRNVGDALQEWKERVSISVDLQDDNKSQGEMEDENANEYGYVSEFEKGTAQALGPATAEQIDADVNVNKPDKNPLVESGDDVTNMEIDEQISEDDPIKHCSSIIKNKMEEQIQVSKLDESANHQSPGVHGPSDGDPGNFSEFLVSVKKSYLSDDVYQINKLSISEEEMGKALDPEEVSGDVKNNATALWRKYELLTTRLSQELAEQLRLVMEPTLASKLQGDYKTGKRLNMKKVIPYIASHYRKDKIWLRRTRPNKRDYQVIIAVDDSYSMSESGCGEVAIKALVTVCRAMSQLEVGNLAVASFGKKGNIRLLHDFDQPFTGESGVKMISSLTFKQENTIRDEPVVDLLMFLNKKLDAAVANARLPSGQNPLQQLVLIIGDGRLYEKEKLKRCVRDVLSSKRMVAFLVLDSLQESIMDLQEVITTQDKNNQFKILVSKYLDSFPFPYYVVLRNIEALPTTLADLLRQWFELMQNSRD